MIEVFLTLVHGQDQYFHIRVGHLNPSGGFNPSEFRHGDIENDHVGNQRIQQIEELETITYFANNLQIDFLLKNHF
jgi:hypothetical protein